MDNKTVGCEYCNEDNIHPARDCILPDGIERMLVVVDNGTFMGKTYIHERKINFCPMCGRQVVDVCKDILAEEQVEYERINNIVTQTMLK